MTQLPHLRTFMALHTAKSQVHHLLSQRRHYQLLMWKGLKSLPIWPKSIFATLMKLPWGVATQILTYMGQVECPLSYRGYENLLENLILKTEQLSNLGIC